MINFAIKNKANGMAITSETVEDVCPPAPLLQGEVLMAIKCFSHNYLPTLVDPLGKIDDDEKEYAKKDLFQFVETITKGWHTNPLPFGEDVDRNLPFSDPDDEEIKERLKDHRTWKKFLKDELPEYDIYTVYAFVHDDVQFEIRRLDESFDDFHEVDGLILMKKGAGMLPNYADLLSDWYNGYWNELWLYIPNDKFGDGEYCLGTLYNSEDNFSYEEDVAKMLAAALKGNEKMDIDPDPNNWKPAQVKTVYQFV